MMRLAHFCCSAALAGVGICATSADARAISPAESILRRQLISQAEMAHDAGNHASALDLARRAATLQMTTSLRYFLAREQEEVGAITEGFTTAEQCELEAGRDPNLRNRETILQECRGIKMRLANRIGHVLIALPEHPAGLRVRIAGQDVNEAAIGLPYAVTPGMITVEATAPDRVSLRTSLKIDRGQTTSVTITLAKVADRPCPPGTSLRGSECVKGSEPLAAVAGASTAGETATLAPPKAAPAARPTEKPRLQTAQTFVTTKASPAAVAEVNLAASTEQLRRTYDLYAAAAGGVFLVAGTVSYLISGSEFSSIKDVCNSTPPQASCTTTRRNDSVSKIQTLDRVAVVSWIVGAVLTGGGLAHHYLLGGREHGSHEASLWIDPLSRALTFESRF